MAEDERQGEGGCDRHDEAERSSRDPADLHTSLDEGEGNRESRVREETEQQRQRKPVPFMGRLVERRPAVREPRLSRRQNDGEARQWCEHEQDS